MHQDSLKIPTDSYSRDTLALAHTFTKHKEGRQTERRLETSGPSMIIIRRRRGHQLSVVGRPSLGHQAISVAGRRHLFAPSSSSSSSLLWLFFPANYFIAHFDIRTKLLRRRRNPRCRGPAVKLTATVDDESHNKVQEHGPSRSRVHRSCNTKQK